MFSNTNFSPMSVPRNNLAEQLALHKALMAKKGAVSSGPGRGSVFTPPHKPPLSLSFSSTNANDSIKSSLHGNSVKPSSCPVTTPKPSSIGSSAVKRRTCTVPSSQSLHKPSLPVAFVAPVVSKATQQSSCEVNPVAPMCPGGEQTLSPLHSPAMPLAATPTTAPHTSLPSIASDKTRPAPSSVPGSSLAFCSIPSLESSRHSPNIQGRPRATVESELEKIRGEKMSAMDDICDLLSGISPKDITSLFGASAAGLVQKKLATRKKLMLREESLKIHLESLPANSTPLSSGFVPDLDSPSPLPPPLPPLAASVEQRHTGPGKRKASSPSVPLPEESKDTPPSAPYAGIRSDMTGSSFAVDPYPRKHKDDSFPTPCSGSRVPGPHLVQGRDSFQRRSSPSSEDMFDADLAGLGDEDWDFDMQEDVLVIEDTSTRPKHTPKAPPPFPSAADSHACRNAPRPYSPVCSTGEQTPSGVREGPRATFKPPFKPGSSSNSSSSSSAGDRLNGSFAAMSGRPSMFKPARNTQQPKDDASEFRGQYPHTREMYKIFNQVFGLKRFRPNQLEAVNAAMLSKDCFVLMPTGGGKSLCYQLPALMTPGVTVVVSPLRSLIQDQVQKLTSLGIPAKHLSSDLSLEEEREVYASLSLREPVTKLLYVTPEKLGASNKLVSTLRGLHNRQMLARFVIDEAHCISQWGHDFRPDYKKLSELRGRFPGVPIMALTATATPRVRADILHQLKMERTCKWFTQSFNRTNLTYLVVAKKPKKAMQDIIELIHKSFPGQSGIVYCLSRRDCEIMAGELCRGNVAALCYHAGLSNDDRSTVQQRWVQEDRCKVVCATIAFGMGIDKPDVRFVIHHSLPKSVEGYYQEAGRAGRDGKAAQCILFYNYSDMARLRRMVKVEKLSYEQEKVHMDNLYRMVQYCENQADCRRMQLLEYFAENFDPELCKNSGTPCDNCQSSVPFVSEDVTDLVKVVVRSVQQVGQDKFTLNQYLDALKGSGVSKIANGELGRLPIYGAGAARTKHDLERLLHMLVVRDVLSESLVIGNHDNVVCYVKTGSQASAVLSGRLTGITLKVKGTGRASAESRKTVDKSVSKVDALKEKCLKELTALRLRVTTSHKLKNPEYVVSSAALQAMASQLPTSKDDMLNVEGYTEIKWDRFEGQRFLEVTQTYAAEVASLQAEGMRGEVVGAETTSAYFKENVEGQVKPRPVVGKGKRKKASDTSGGSSGAPPPKKQLPLNWTENYDSGDEFEAPGKSRREVETRGKREVEVPAKNRRTPLKGLVPHPNNR